MALQKTIEIDSGITIKNAYHRISYISGDKSNVAIQLCAYVDDSSALAGKKEIDKKIYYYQPLLGDGVNDFIKQGYLYIKTLDEFKDAIDC